MMEFQFDKVFVLDDGKHAIGYQEYQTIIDDNEIRHKFKGDAILLLTAKGDKIETSDPDGAERDYWLNQIGILSDDEFQVSAKKLQAPEDRKALYNLLDNEQGEDSAKKLKADKVLLQQEIRGLEDRLTKEQQRRREKETE